MNTANPPQAPLLQTPLHALHLEWGARMVPFAGYAMPVQYASGLMAEHLQCRNSAALFDVSHMGQISLSGAGAAAALETLVPMDVQDLPLGKQRYAFFTNAEGGLLDDLMITRREADFLLVVNAGCKAADLAHLQAHIGAACTITPWPDRALLALQGPLAGAVLAAINPAAAQLTFMTGAALQLGAADCFVTRSGYTGEDGFEISVAADQAEALARQLVADARVKPAGLGARDTLRLEAGMCLYGHDIDEHTTPVEAALSWAIQKVRRPGGARSGGYPGATVLESQWVQGAARKRVGLVGLERVPVREGAALFNAAGESLGRVTSGTLAPSVQQAVALAYVRADHSAPGSELFAEVRGKRVPMRVVSLPFQAHRYFRG